MRFVKSKQVHGWIHISIYLVSVKNEIVFVETQSLIQEKTIVCWKKSSEQVESLVGMSKIKSKTVLYSKICNLRIEE